MNKNKGVLANLTYGNLGIGFSVEPKIIERNIFELEGDINLHSCGIFSLDLRKIKVVYNHDGLLEDIYRNGELDKFLLFKDIEMNVNSREKQIYPIKYTDCKLKGDEYYCKEVRINDDNSIEVYIDATMAYDDDQILIK